MKESIEEKTVELYNRAVELIVLFYEVKELLLDLSIWMGVKFIVQEIWYYTENLNL